MTYSEAKSKYSDQVLSTACVDIVLAGLSDNLNRGEEYHNAFGLQVLACIKDINKSSWDDIRSIIKRLL